MNSKLFSKLATLTLTLGIAASASAIPFSGTGWTMDVTITGGAPSTAPWVNAFQDADTARLGYQVLGNNVAWGVSTNPSVPLVSPNPNTLTGTYTITAAPGYQLNGLDLTAAGTWRSLPSNAGGFSGSNVTLNGVVTPYTFATNGTWLANATDLVFTPGTSTFSGSFAFRNDPPNGLVAALMSGSANTGPEFTVSASAVPTPSVLSLMFGGLAMLGYGARRKKATQ